MGCCSNSPRPDLELDYEKKDDKVDVEFENATDATGAKLVEGI